MSYSQSYNTGYDSQMAKKGPAHKKQKTKQRPGVMLKVPRWFDGEKPSLFKMSRRIAAGAMLTSGAGIINSVVQTNDPSQCTDFGNLSALYDEYKVMEVRVKYVPNYNTAWPGVASTGGYFAPVYVVYDPDSSTGPASVDNSLQYGNHKIKNLAKPWSYRIKNRTQTDNSISNAGTAITYDEKYGVLLDVAIAANYQKGVIAFYADTLPFNVDFGTLIVDYFVYFFTRR